MQHYPSRRENRSFCRARIACLAGILAQATVVQAAPERSFASRVTGAFSENPLLYVWLVLGFATCYLLSWFILRVLVTASEMPGDAGCAGCLGGAVAASLFVVGLIIMVVPGALLDWILWLILLVLAIIIVVTLITKARTRVGPLLLLFLLLFAVVVLLKYFGPQIASSDSGKESGGGVVGSGDVERLKDAVVLVAIPVPGEATKLDIGTGFFIDGNSTFVTCRHCVGENAKVKIVTHNKEILVADVLATDAQNDLALCRTTGGSKDYFALGQSGTAKVGEEVETIGYALAIVDSAKQGQIDPSLSGALSIGAIRSDSLQISGAINHGNSGGPLFDKATAKVIGVVAAKAQGEGAEGVGFATPMDRVQVFLDRYYHKQ